MSMASRGFLMLLVLPLGAVMVEAQEPHREAIGAPLSAIDWLSESITAVQPATPFSSTENTAGEDPVADSATTPQVTVTTLDATSPDVVGLLPPDVTGLPRSLWSGSSEALLAELVQAERVETLPAIQNLLITLMLAEADPPLGATPSGPLFLARIDKLLDFGALEPARELLVQAGPDSPEIFRRWFDASLLMGVEDNACAVIRDRPAIAPTYPARIFCLARGGDWSAAALTLNTARALGDVTDEEDALLSRFLDPDLFEGEAALPPPSRPSPLVFRMREAIGEGLTTGNLPRAFSHADLRATAPWRNQMEAAERLARYGAIPDNVLLDFYMMRTPAASGGVWDRARAVQRFEAALDAEDPDALATTLPDAWAAMQASRNEVAFANIYGARLAALPVDGEVAELVFQIRLLSTDYEEATIGHEPRNDDEALWQAIARGEVSEIPDAARSEQEVAAIIAAFDGSAVISPALDTLITSDRLGEALLRIVAHLHEGARGDLGALTEGLALLRRVGLEDVARRAALQLLLLERQT